MAQLMASIASDYESAMDSGDPRVKEWFLMSSPFPTVAICLFYLYFVTRLGPRLMKNREAFKLRPLLLLYNGFQVYFSCWMFKEGLLSGWWGNYSLKCQPVDYSNNPTAMRMANAVWWFYFSKFTELSDTVFFVLRKKNDHITVLHLIHHGGIPIATWFGTKFVPGGHSTFCGMLNTFVHAVMYSYYFISALKPKWKGYLKFKKWVTLLQIAQFVLIMAHALQLLVVDCDYPRSFVWFISFHGLLFLILFSNFYLRTYAGSKKRAAVTKAISSMVSEESEETIIAKKIISNGFNGDIVMRKAAEYDE
uniref:Elongation of very long chain fatty acids protein n=1 Tax=Orthetrum albistylum TaxID=254766 RepID=A0A499U8U6_9ODON|nr:elongation of very long chain fatty acids protein 12 [Orthetrum albistylum]